MTYPISKFRFLDRGHRESMLLIPGWATDLRIFEPLDLPFNYVLPEDLPPMKFYEAFAGSVDELNISELHLLGWSMGGFMAASLASKYPSMFKSVTLVSVRRGYDKDGIEKIKGYVRKNAKAYLYKFYEGLFSASEDKSIRWFKTELLKKYLCEMMPENLLDGLDYLYQAKLDCGAFPGSRVTFIHGDADDIAPIEEARAVREGLPEAKFIPIAGARHLPFLGAEFKLRAGFYNG